MISLKDYILESIFDSPEAINKGVLKNIKKNVDAWVKSNMRKSKGRISTKIEGDKIVVYYNATGTFDSISINMNNCPDIVSFNIACRSLTVTNCPDNVLNKFISLDCGKLGLEGDTLTNLGEIEDKNGLSFDIVEIEGPVSNYNVLNNNSRKDFKLSVYSEASSIDMSKLEVSECYINFPNAKSVKYPKSIYDLTVYNAPDLASCPSKLHKLYCPIHSGGLKTWKGCTIKEVKIALLWIDSKHDYYVSEVDNIPNATKQFSVNNTEYIDNSNWSNSNEDKLCALALSLTYDMDTQKYTCHNANEMSEWIESQNDFLTLKYDSRDKCAFRNQESLANESIFTYVMIDKKTKNLAGRITTEKHGNDERYPGWADIFVTGNAEGKKLLKSISHLI